MADGGGLENRYARERIGGSNPSPSALEVCFVLHCFCWRDGRVAEGTSLLRMRTGNCTEGSNPSFSASILLNENKTL